MYIIKGLRVILRDTDINIVYCLFFIRITLGTVDNLIWEKTQKGDLK